MAQNLKMEPYHQQNNESSRSIGKMPGATSQYIDMSSPKSSIPDFNFSLSAQSRAF